MTLENAKKQCFAYDGISGCSVLDYVKTCKGCRFYKTKPQLEREQRLSEKRRSLIQRESGHANDEASEAPHLDDNTKETL